MLTKIISCMAAAKELALSGLWGALAWCSPYPLVRTALVVVATIHLMLTLAKLAQRRRSVAVDAKSNDYVHVGGGLTSSSSATVSQDHQIHLGMA